MHFYFVGIKGTGMSALANILADLGHEVSGVDYSKKYFTEATFRKSIIVENFDNYKLSDKYFYIIGNAFKLADITNEIKARGYHFEYYPLFIEGFFKMDKIGVAGSHGKTTTTSFISQLVSTDINYLIGDGSGRGVNEAKYFLFEACEYQNHFLNYTFKYLVVLNIDYDHPDFFKSVSEYTYAFQKAALNAECLIINYDDDYCKKIVHKNKITFGFNPNADVVIRLANNKLYLTFDEAEYEFEFKYYGKYMAYNLVASFIVSYLVDGNVEGIVEKIHALKLPSRRFNESKIRDNVILVDDYAHHPTEIKTVIGAIKTKYPNYKVAVVYQGHTYSRTMAFYNEYVNVLKDADIVYIMPIFSSVREEDFDEWALLRGSDSFKKYSKDSIEKLIESQNIVIAFIGAGDIDTEFNFLNKKVNYWKRIPYVL